MRSAVTALAWEIGKRNRGSVRGVAGIIAFAWLLNLVIPDSFRATNATRQQLLTMNCLLMAGSLFLACGIFTYTEADPQKEWSGFPYRLFALPVPTWLLVGLPMLLGVASVELILLLWLKLVFVRAELALPGWFAVLLGSYMVFYQTLLWSLAGFRILRILTLGLAGTSVIGVAFLPFFAQYAPSPWLSPGRLSLLLGMMSLASFIIAWISVARQRCGGGRRKNWLKELLDLVTDVLPRRRRGFASPAQAQLWFEWRRAGMVLPFCVASVLFLVILPLSWLFREDTLATMWILGWTFALPALLSLPIGKGYSKPDFWAANLSLPAFVATRPLATGEMVVVKMKAAALSALVSWGLVLAFLAAWLPLWANLTALNGIRIGLWMVYNHSVWPQYVMAALLVMAGMMLTWRGLVGGLWIGLSGSKKLFVGSTVVRSALLLAGFVALQLLVARDAVVRPQLRYNPDMVLAPLVWVTALAVIGKYWLAAITWRHITPTRSRRYISAWACGALCLIALGILIWAAGCITLTLMALLDISPLDVSRLKALFILMAFLVIPFARLGLAPSSLAKNRHA